MEAENKNIIGYIVETDPCKEYGMPNYENRYLFQTKIMAYRYILKLVDKVKAEYRRILDYNKEIDETGSTDAYTYSISTTVRAAFGFEDVSIMLKRKSINSQYLAEPIRDTRISVIPICSKPEEETIQDLKITATADDAANFIRKNAAIVVKQPGQPFMEFAFTDNTEEEYDPE